MSKRSDDKEWLNTLLDPDDAAKFAEVQKRLGIRARSEVVRVLITKEYHRITGAQSDAPSVDTQACA